MNKLQELKADFLKAQDKRELATQNAHRKAEEISQLTLETRETKERLLELENYLSNARKGLGSPYSAEELLAFKKELADKTDQLDDFQLLLPVKNNELSSAKNESRYAGRELSDIYTKIADQVITESASEIAAAVESQLKLMVTMTLSEGDLNSKGSQLAEYLYMEVGRKLCERVLPVSGCGSSVVLPTIHEAQSTRDLFIDDLA